MTGTELSERRKADRAKMAAQVAALASRHGIKAQVTGDGERRSLRHRATSVDLEGPHGLRLTVKFRGDSPQAEPDTYVLSWHGVEDGWRLSPRWFPYVNEQHGQKATDVVRGYLSLLDLFERRFPAIADGAAFIPEGRP